MSARDGGERRRQQQRSKGGIRKHLLFVVEEKKREVDCLASYLVFKMNLKDMFASDSDADEDLPAMRSLPVPFTQLDTPPGSYERLDLALLSGTNIVAVSSHKRTAMLHIDSAADGELSGPELRYNSASGYLLIPLGTRLYAIGRYLNPPFRNTHPSYQALQPPTLASGRWSWRPLPDPPSSLYRARLNCVRPKCNITATMAAGTRVWVSAPARGTYSFDTARLAWRKEGDWELPFQGHGLVVSDLQHQQQQSLLCLGICPRRFCLCAFDVPVTGTGQAPAARYIWQEETLPHECNRMRFPLLCPASLAYLGDGNLCITWTIGIEHDRDKIATRFALFLIAIQIVSDEDDGELRVVKRKVRFYKLPSRGTEGYVLNPSLV